MGAIGWSRFSRPPGAPGARRGGRALVRPFQYIPSYILAPSGVLGRRGLVSRRFGGGPTPGVVTKISG